MSKEQAPRSSDAGQRKDRVLHTRIPDALDREIKRRASRLGLSASTVVRNVLLHTFDLVEDLVHDSTNFALAVANEDGRPSSAKRRGRARAASDNGEPTQLGWQELTLNLNAVCDRCNAVLEKGGKAAVAVHDVPGPRVIVCLHCVASEHETP